MKIMRYLLGAVMALSIVGCEPIEDETKSYPELESLVGTLWFSYDETNKIFYDITYGEDDRGEMKGYADQERTELVVDRPFSYTFTPATDDVNAIVRVDFEDGQHYGGALMPKGYIQVNYIDVYFIQLYEVYENGEVIKDAEGNFTSVIQMWKE
jgi:hypothetical protein